MGITKTNIYDSKTNLLAGYLKVLGHPARISILQYLIKSDTCICGDLVNEIGLAQATISQHLKELKSIGLIQGNIEGTSICYCINPEKWNQLQELLIPFIQKINYKNNCKS